MVKRRLSTRHWTRNSLRATTASPPACLSDVLLFSRRRLVGMNLAEICFMDLNSRANLQGLKVVSFESRRAVEIAELIRRYGGDPFVAPSMREVPLEENRAALELIPDLEAGEPRPADSHDRRRHQDPQPGFVKPIFARANHCSDAACKVGGARAEAGSRSERVEVVPAISVPEPNTWREILATLDPRVDLRGQRIAIQEYGVPNPELTAALQVRGATVSAIPIYRWDLPEDLEPLRQAIEKITQGHAEVVLFTNGAQVDHLFRVAAESNNTNSLREGLERAVVGSVGPICTEVLDRFGIDPDIEPAHPKMGSLLAEVAASAQPLLEAKRRA